MYDLGFPVDCVEAVKDRQQECERDCIKHMHSCSRLHKRVPCYLDWNVEAGKHFL